MQIIATPRGKYLKDMVICIANAFRNICLESEENQ